MQKLYWINFISKKKPKLRGYMKIARKINKYKQQFRANEQVIGKETLHEKSDLFNEY